MRAKLVKVHNFLNVVYLEFDFVYSEHGQELFPCLKKITFLILNCGCKIPCFTFYNGRLNNENVIVTINDNNNKTKEKKGTKKKVLKTAP